MVEPENTGRKQGRFVQGTSGNPAGRPKGSLNRTTLLYRDLLDGDGKAVVRKAIEQARDGEPVALRLVLERLIPPRRSESAPLDLPRIARAEDLVLACAEVIAAAADGRITLAEAREWMGLLERQRMAVETADLAVRVEVLEREQREARELESRRRRLG